MFQICSNRVASECFRIHRFSLSLAPGPRSPPVYPTLSLPNIIWVYADYTIRVRLCLQLRMQLVSNLSIWRPLGLYVSAWAPARSGTLTTPITTCYCYCMLFRLSLAWHFCCKFEVATPRVHAADKPAGALESRASAFSSDVMWLAAAIWGSRRPFTGCRGTCQSDGLFPSWSQLQSLQKL